MAEASNTQDAIQLLKEDHRKVEDLFEQFEKASGDSRKQKLASQICEELIIHSMIEEEIFYPACEGHVDEELLKEAVVEHDSAKVLIAEIQAGEPSEDFYDSKVKVLQEQIEHHVKEEEKGAGSVFGQLRKADVDLKELGERLATRKSELMRQAKEGKLPEPETKTLEQAQI